MAFDVTACALAATWASTLRASSFSRLVQDVRRGEGRSPVANASAAVRLVGTLRGARTDADGRAQTTTAARGGGTTELS